MEDVVRTTILSKRWKDLWTTVPCLDFGDAQAQPNRSFVHEALAKWKGDKILKFRIFFIHGGDDLPTSDVLDSWLHLPIEKQVEDLSIYFPRVDHMYCAPHPLYSCSFITKLSLLSCNLKIEENANVQRNQLKSLTIERPIYLSEHAVNRIHSGAPLLEELVLNFLEISENLNIRSTSLKMLKINMLILRFRELVGNDLILKIWGPNLLSLEISGYWHTMCLLNVPSLTNATLS